MRCPFCGFTDQRVLDSRPAREGEAIRRRRECTACGRRFTTFEEPERVRLYVVKKDGSLEEFSRDKCMNSMHVACHKRQVSVDAIREAAERIERDLFREYEDEVPARAIGEKVLKELRALDQVAYVRFASVYLDFDEPKDFRKILDSMRDREPAKAHRD